MDGKPGPCWDHPGVREAATGFIAEPWQVRWGKYKNIWAWNTFQEIGFWPNTAGKLGFCYCPHTLARFREWLREKYGSLAALNAAWQINYADLGRGRATSPRGAAGAFHRLALLHG